MVSTVWPEEYATGFHHAFKPQKRIMAATTTATARQMNKYPNPKHGAACRTRGAGRKIGAAPNP
jgi:hypothetical protein